MPTGEEHRARRRDFYLDALRVSYAQLNPRQRARLKRRHPIVAIALAHLVDEELI